MTAETMDGDVIDNTASFDTRELRDVLGIYATGVAVMTTIGEENAPVGMAANSFASVSLDPPLILWSIDLNAPSIDAFRNHGSFVVNIMGEDSKEETMNFARPSDDKFNNVDWSEGCMGAPILNNAIAFLDCKLENRITAGDHEILIGSVQQINQTDGNPLLFHSGKFQKLGSEL